MRHVPIVGLAALIVCATGPRAEAQTFTNLAAWQAAAGGAGELEDLEGVAPGPLVLGSNPAGLVEILLTGDTASGNAFVDGGAVNGSRELTGTVTTNQGSSRTLTLVFPEPVIAFAASFASASTGNHLTVSSASESYRLADFGVNDGFFGFVEGSPFDAVVLTSPFEGFQMDDVRFVPEPGALVAGLAALAALGALARARPGERPAKPAGVD